MKIDRTVLFCLSLFFLFSGCDSHGKHKTQVSRLADFDSIATVDGANYYWDQIETNGARIYKEEADGNIDTCVVLGYAYGALPAPIEVDTMAIQGGSVFPAVPSREQIVSFSKRYFFIDLGEEGYMLFDPKNFPDRMDLWGNNVNSLPRVSF